MKKKRVIALLLCMLALPLPTPAAAMDDMFAVMFRMMLVMMNVMSGAMLGNTSNSSFGTNDSFGFGMGGWPEWSSLYGMSPVSGVSSFPGMNPWSGMGSFPVYAQGLSPWSTPVMPNAWTYPFASGYPPSTNLPYSSSGYGWQPEGRAAAPVSLLDGRWFGSSGEVFEVSGNRFRLVHGKLAITGVVKIENNIVNLYSQQTGTVTQYSFVRNQTELMLQDASGMVLNFSKRPINSAVHMF